MLTRQRKELILAKLKQDGQIVAATLSDELGLSEDTIRRDLRALAAEGLLQRVHGGALPSSPAVATLSRRRDVEPASKLSIAKVAAQMIHAGQVVFLDGGTTCQQLAHVLPHSLHATVVTHSPTIAVELSDHPAIDVILIGGRLFKHSMVAVGATAIESINRIQADLYFMGVTGLSVMAGLTTGDMEEASIKRALMARAAETWVLASPEKLTAASSYVIAPCKEATGVIVQKGEMMREAAKLKKLGISIVVA